MVKKNNPEKVKFIYLGTFLALFIAFIVLLSINVKDTNSAVSTKMIADYQVAMASSEATILYLGRTTCSYCQLLNELLTEFEEKYDLKYTYIDSEKVSTNDFSKILSDLKISAETFGTPYLVAVKNGVVVESLIGYNGEEATLDFFKKYGNIPTTATVAMNYVDYLEFKTIMASPKNEIMVIGATSCSYCQKARPIFNEIIDENDIVINYININLISTESDYNLLIAMLNAKYGSGTWGTPITLIVKNNVIVDSPQGLTTKDKYEALFIKNGIME